MIIQERFQIKEREFIRTYSDEGRYVVRDGVSYEEANDPAEFERVYTEGELIPTEEQTDDVASPEDYENALAEMGVDFSD